MVGSGSDVIYGVGCVEVFRAHCFFVKHLFSRSASDISLMDLTNRPHQLDNSAFDVKCLNENPVFQESRGSVMA